VKVLNKKGNTVYKLIIFVYRIIDEHRCVSRCLGIKLRGQRIVVHCWILKIIILTLSSEYRLNNGNIISN